MPGLTVTEKSHGCDRIAARIFKTVELLGNEPTTRERDAPAIEQPKEGLMSRKPCHRRRRSGRLPPANGPVPRLSLRKRLPNYVMRSSFLPEPTKDPSMSDR